MRKFEAFVLGAFLWPVPVLFCFMMGWLVGDILFGERYLPAVALSGLAVGAILATIFIRGWVGKAYNMNSKVVAAVYIFYSIGLFGFCMGIPILNFPLGMVAGVYTARKMYYAQTSEEECKRNISRMAVFTALVMFMVCCLMVLWGLAGRVSGKDFEALFKSLLGLELTINTAGFVGIIFFGACAMILLQYWLTRLSAKITLNCQGKVCA